MTEEKQEQPIIIVSLALSQSMGHPNWKLIPQPQVVAKHHVTHQQIGYALLTISLQYTVDNVHSLRFRITDQHTNYAVPDTDFQQDYVECDVCHHGVPNKDMIVSRPNDPTGAMLIVTLLQIHRTVKHGYRMQNSQRIVEFLGLKPNTRYYPEEKPILLWKLDSYAPIPGPLTTKAIPMIGASAKSYTYNANGTTATVYSSIGQRIVLLECKSLSHDIVVEGHCISKELLSNHHIRMYTLQWKCVLIPRDWLCT